MQNYDQRITDLSECYDLFKLDCEGRNLTESSKRSYKSKLEPFLKHCTDNGIGLDNITSVTIRSYLASEKKRGIADHTMHGVARAIRSFLNFCVREKLIAESPFNSVRMPKLPKLLPIVFTEQEVRQVFASCDKERDKTICLFLLETGCRGSELVGINANDIDWDNGTCRIFGKGRKERQVYMSVRLRKQVKRYLLTFNNQPKGNSPLFTAYSSGERLTYWGLEQLMERLQKRAGIEKIRTHTFRRTFATTQLRNGMNIYLLAKLMGHSDIQVLRHYLGLDESDVTVTARDIIESHR